MSHHRVPRVLATASAWVATALAGVAVAGIEIGRENVMTLLVPLLLTAAVLLPVTFSCLARSWRARRAIARAQAHIGRMVAHTALVQVDSAVTLQGTLRAGDESGRRSSPSRISSGTRRSR